MSCSGKFFWRHALFLRYTFHLAPLGGHNNITHLCNCGCRVVAFKSTTMATTDSISVFAEGTFEEQVCDSFMSILFHTPIPITDPRTRKLCRPKSIRGEPSCLYKTLSRCFENSSRRQTFGRKYPAQTTNLFHGPIPCKWLRRGF